MKWNLSLTVAVGTLAAACLHADEPVQNLTPFPVVAPVALETTAIGFDQPVSALRQDVRVDLHARGGPERQSDVTVRGGIFESTGFQLGSMTLLDPQTGHYSAELPLDPAFLSGPSLKLGTSNSLRGFNASVATVHYGFAPVREGGRLSAGFGSHNHRELRAVGGAALGQAADSGWFVQAGAAHARGDGSVDGGDYSFERFSGRVRHRSEQSQTDFFAGYTDKFYGWPGLYTGISQLHETDHYQVSVLGVQHQMETASGSVWELGGFWRRLVDDYQFNREEPNTFFQHETQVAGFQGNGEVPLSDDQRLLVGWTLMADEIVDSTALVHGSFNSRSYKRLSAAFEQDMDLASGYRAQFQAGAAWDDSNRDGSAVSPFGRLQWGREHNGGQWQTFVEASQTTQLPGYTALNSAPSGLFGGNPELGREKARVVEAGWSATSGDLGLRVSGFRRWDRELADWTFSSDQTSARQANAVDLDVWGVEALLNYHLGDSRWSLGYAWLDKSPDYGTTAVDASYYALNYARHRLTVSGHLPLHERVSAQIDTEWRLQSDNVLRQSSDRGFRLNLGLTWMLDADGHWQWSLVGENLTDDDFEHYPGVIATGRQWTTQLAWRF